MGYGGKLRERNSERAELRAEAWTMPGHRQPSSACRSPRSASGSGTSSSFRTLRRGSRIGPRTCCTWPSWPRSMRSTLDGVDEVAQLSDREFLLVGTALVHRRGLQARRTGRHGQHRSPRAAVLRDLVAPVLRRSTRSRCVYVFTCTKGLDLEAAEQFWSDAARDSAQPVPAGLPAGRRSDETPLPNTRRVPGGGLLRHPSASPCHGTGTGAIVNDALPG